MRDDGNCVFEITCIIVLLGIIALASYSTLSEFSRASPEPLKEVVQPHLPTPLHDSHYELWDIEQNRHLRCRESVECMKLAEVGYYEARGESDEGVLLVMKTVMNRAEHKRWEDSIVGVVNEPHQFSYLWDGSLEKAKNNPKQWKRMYHLAHKMLNGDLTLPKSWSNITHYHSAKVKPFWAKHYKQITLVGNHIAYKCEKDC